MQRAWWWITAVLVLALLLASAGCQKAVPQPEESDQPPPTPVAAQVFAANCAGCHGDQGQGGRGPAIKPSKLSEQDLFMVIADGRGDMPAFRGRLAESEVQALISFLRGE